jgi:hypothetical protein
MTLYNNLVKLREIGVPLHHRVLLHRIKIKMKTIISEGVIVAGPLVVREETLHLRANLHPKRTGMNRNLPEMLLCRRRKRSHDREEEGRRRRRSHTPR